MPPRHRFARVPNRAESQLAATMTDHEEQAFATELPLVYRRLHSGDSVAAGDATVSLARWLSERRAKANTPVQSTVAADQQTDDADPEDDDELEEEEDDDGEDDDVESDEGDEHLEDLEDDEKDVQRGKTKQTDASTDPAVERIVATYNDHTANVDRRRKP